MFKKFSLVLVLLGGCVNPKSIFIDVPYIVVPPAPVPDNPPPLPKENLIHINSDGEYNAIPNKDDAVIYFFATWCGPCKQQAPVYEDLARDNPKIMFYKVDVDLCKRAASSKGVSAIPTIFINGKKFVGFTTKEKLQAELK